MKRILLVDDELPARQLVKDMLDWDAAGFAVAYEAANGAEALDLYRQHQPDLIISDIQMPVMDGLELLTLIRHENQGLPFIVLSCYERFDYARQIIQLGGLDYLIKDALTADTLYAALQRALEKMEVQKRDVPLSAPAIPADSAPPAPLSAWLNQALLSQTAISPDDDIFSVSQPGTRGYLFISAGWNVLEGFALAEGLPEKLEQQFPDICGFCTLADDLLIAVATFSALNQEDERKERYHLLRNLQNCLLQMLGSPVSLGVSSLATDAGSWQLAYRQCLDALEYRSLMGSGSILFYSPVQNTNLTVQRRLIEMRIEKLRASLAQNDPDAVQEQLIKLYQNQLGGMMHFHYLQYLNSILWGIVVEERLARDDSLASPNLDRKTYDELCQCDCADDMRDAFSALFQHVLQLGSQREESTYSQRVRHVLQFINDNLAQDISLDTIADYFELHKAHLARVFKQETGFGIHEYIRTQRIETAKSLLKKSQYRVNEIVYLAGFKSPQNFYSLFMRYVGLTPNEYRDKFG